MEPYPKFFGARLRRLIDEKGITIVQFGREFPLSEANVHNWLKREAPPLQKYWSRLADYFECPADTIVHGAPRKQVPGLMEIGAVAEEQPHYGANIDDIYAELHGVIDAAINAAGEDPERALYLLDQLRQHLRIPAHWLAGRPSKKAPATGIVVPKARSGAHREERATG